MGNKSFIRYIKASFSNKNTKNMKLLKQIRFKKKKKKEKSAIHQTNSYLNGLIWTFILIHLYLYLKWYRYEIYIYIMMCNQFTSKKGENFKNIKVDNSKQNLKGLINLSPIINEL